MSQKDSEDYVVGHRKPPKWSRFKKGQSGNPSGRPRARLNPTDIFLATLEERIPVTASGKRQYMYRLEAIANQIVMGAAKGDAKMMKVLFEVLTQFDPSNLQPVVELRLTRMEMEV